MPQNGPQAPQPRGAAPAPVPAPYASAIISRVASENNVPEEQAAIWYDEMLRWLSLVNRPVPAELAGPIAPSPDVDEAWHAFILFTEIYTAYCRLHFGQYMHHIPTMPGEEGDHAPYYRSRDRILYEYGDIDTQVWPYLADRNSSRDQWRKVGWTTYPQSLSVDAQTKLNADDPSISAQVALAIAARPDIAEFATDACGTFLLPGEPFKVTLHSLSSRTDQDLDFDIIQVFASCEHSPLGDVHFVRSDALSEFIQNGSPSTKDATIMAVPCLTLLP